MAATVRDGGSTLGRLTQAGDGSAGLAATHVDIAAAACTELIKLLESGRSRRPHTSEDDRGESNLQAAGDMDAFVRRLTLQLREAKRTAEIALDAKASLVTLLQEQKQKWQKEKADMCARFNKERQQLLQRLQGAQERAQRLQRSVGTQTNSSDVAANATQTSSSEHVAEPLEEENEECDIWSPQSAPGLEKEIMLPIPSSPPHLRRRAETWPVAQRVPLTFSPGDENQVNQDLLILGTHLSRCFGTPDAVLSDLHEAQLPDGVISAEHFEELLHSRWGAARLLAGSPRELWDMLAGGADHLDVRDLFKNLQSVLSVNATEDLPDIDECVEKMRAPFRNQQEKFLAKGTVTEKAAQYELEVCRRRSDIHLGRTLERSRGESTPQRRRTVQFVGGQGYGATP